MIDRKSCPCLAAIAFALLSGLLLVRPSVVEAGTNDIVVDTASQALQGGGGAFSLTISHTVNAGSNRILIVGVAYGSNNQEVTGVTYAGVPFIVANKGGLLGTTQVQPVGTGRMELWYLIAPTVGTANIVISFASKISSSGGGVSLFGVNQGDGGNTFGSGYFSSQGESAGPTVTVTTSTKRDAVIDTCASTTPVSDITLATGAAQTKRWSGTAGGSNIYGLGSTAPGPDIPGNVVMSWTISGPRNWACGGAALKPAAAPTAVELLSFAGLRREDGRILLRWRTRYEADNLGFHIYREEGGRRVRLTPELIGGSALLSRAALAAGSNYRWVDEPPAERGPVRYWLEDVDLDGTRTLHGPIVPEYNPQPLPEQKASGVLSTLGRKSQEGYRTHHQAQALRGRLQKRPVKQFRAREHTGKKGKSGPRPDPSPNDRVNQAALAGIPGVKILVREEGWYRVGQPDLVAVGLDPGVDPRSLRLYADGKEQAIVVTGERDGRFDPADAVEFYGTGQNTPWSGERVYWLAAGKGRGARRGARGVSLSRGGSAAAASFAATAQLRERTIYFPALLNGEAENFFGAVVSPAEAVDQVLEVPVPDARSRDEALLEVVLQGVSAGAHRVAVYLNMVRVGEVSFSGRESGKGRFALPHGGLRDGENLVTLAALGEENVSLVDAIRLGYRRLYRAEGGSLRCSAPGGARLEIGGFSGPGVRVMDVTDPSRTLELDGRVRRTSEGYVFQAAVPGRGERQLLAFSEGAVRAPERLVENLASAWSRERVGADVVMISHGDFLGALEPLARLRESQGLSVARVDVADLYDEFSFGSKSPLAVRDFLLRAYKSWITPPRFVLFAGDASFDPRNYLGLGDFDLLPTKVVDTQYLETASDDWFGDFDDDGLAEMAFGRLPVRTVQEAADVAAKITSQDGAFPAGGEALLVADENEEFDFEESCRKVGKLLPPGMGATEIFRGRLGTEAARDELRYRMGLAPSLVAYFGHGTIGGWRDDLLTADDAATAAGFSPRPLFIDMTCLNGMFHDLYGGQSLAEALLLNPDGGAAAVWASSGLTEPGGQLRMAQELARQLYGEEALTLGEAVQRAKAAVTDRDVRRTWILFGDPAMNKR